MSNSTPPDLRVLCRKLTSIPPTQLHHALPSLINHVLHCKEALSAPHEQRPKGKSSEESQLVHKLKASVTTLLNGRSREARFAAIGLIKAMVDVGGWEVLQGSDPWVRGLFSVIQKADPMASKELAVVTLTRIYMLIHPYQTLVREIATRTLPDFITTSISLIKQPPSDGSLKTPFSVIETVCDAFSTLIPLYPTTFRPFSSQLRTATRHYIAPTQSDDFFIPASLTRAARRLVISLHHVAAKSGGSDEWAKLVSSLLRDLHSTADQVLRAVNESWEGSEGYSRSKVSLDGEPKGAGDLPVWSGIGAGADRLIGLFQYLSDCLRYPTKTPVTIPTSALVDAASRVFLIARLSPKSQTWDQALQTNAAIGREEKDELWSLIPDIHISALRLLQVLIQRLQQNTVPLVPELLDHLVRVFKSGINFPDVRVVGYSLLKDIIDLSGPTLSRPSVDMLGPLLGACCRDLQQDAGHLQPTEKPAATSGTDSKKSTIATNADLFLKPQSTTTVVEAATTLDPKHNAAAASLLVSIPSHLPQRYLKPSLRGLVDQTAILTSNRDAMLGSVLNPFKDQRGRVYPSILPHLVQQFPDTQGLEILRTNLRTNNQALADGEEPLEELPVDHEDQEDEEMETPIDDKPASHEKTEDLFKVGSLAATAHVQTSLPIQSNPFEVNKGGANDVEARHRAASPPKRKHEGSDTVPTKRQVLERSPSPLRTVPAPLPSKATEEVSEDDDDDDESVHLNMELEDEEDDDDDDDDEE
ncbi:rRNA processing/ribosome biogenesis-domain-containing protein [Mariannaea sp. PMI_226]|nr:rRNA processing/ribosome biogenesis-domain-containing protein [Mariannaea sp. PMI_226]